MDKLPNFLARQNKFPQSQIVRIFNFSGKVTLRLRIIYVFGRHFKVSLISRRLDMTR